MTRTRSRLIILIVTSIGGLIVWSYAVRLIRDKEAEEAFQTVYRLGGRVGSLGAWPLGKEYAVSFPPGNDVTNETVEQLIVLNAVTEDDLYLNVRNTQITDEGLRKLHDLKTIDSIVLNPETITEDGVAELRLAWPHCYIFHE